MKIKPMRQTTGGYEPCDPSEATHIRFMTPGPFLTRILPVYPNLDGWTWNRDCERPTLSPSILTRDGFNVCHSFVRDGQVEFLNDCTHEFAGQTLPLIDFNEVT